MRYMYAQHPDIATRWEDKYGIPKKLPKHVKKKKRVEREQQYLKHQAKKK